MWLVILVLLKSDVIADESDVRDDMFITDLVTISEIQNTDKDYIHVAMIICDSNKTNSQQNRIKNGSKSRGHINVYFQLFK